MKNIVILFFINLIIFISFALFSKINCEIVLKNPDTIDYILSYGKNNREISLVNDELLEVQIPIYASDFNIQNVGTDDVSAIFINGDETDSFEQIREKLLQIKIKTLFKVFKYSILATVLAKIIMMIFFCKRKENIFDKWIHNKKVLYFSFACLGFFVVLNFYHIFQNAVDVPFMDEWEAFNPDCLSSKFNLNWIFAFHNEHKIIWTKLSMWILYSLDGWNLRHQIIANFFLYLACLVALYKIIPYKNNLMPLFFIPFFSDVLIDNALTGFQSQFYFMLLFAFIAVYFGFVKENSLKNTILFCVFTIFSMFSMTFLVGIALFTAYFIKERSRNTLIAGILIGVGIVLFCINSPSIPQNTSLPYQFSFWSYFCKLLTVGILNLKLPVVFNMLFGVFTAVLFIYVLRNSSKKDFLPYIPLFLLSFALISGIALCRNYSMFVASRHLTVVVYLIPCIASLLGKIKADKVFCIFLITILMSFTYSFDNFTELKEAKLKGKEVLLDFVKADNLDNKVIVPEIYPFELSKKVHRAVELNVHFLNN